MSKSDGAETDDSPIEAIRSLVEKNELGLQTLEDEVLILDDIVWRSPARQIVDPTDIIKRLAEEADKVANGKVKEPPRAAIHRRSPPPKPQSAEPAQSPHKGERQREPKIARPGIRMDAPAAAEAESLIQQRVLEDLSGKGFIDENGRLGIEKEELRLLVRGHIERWTEEQNDTSAEDALQARGIMRKTTPHPGVSDPD